MDIFASPYLKYANQTINWLKGDTEELFQFNLKTNLDKLEKNHWVNSTFTYKFNSNGFRCENFTDDPSIVFLGCSHTVGIGLPLETTWPYLVSLNLGLKCYNLGIGGSANDTSFRLAHAWLPKLNPKIVILCETYPGRLEVLPDYIDNYQCILPARIPDWSLPFYKKWTANENNSKLNQLKNLLAIKELCSSKKIRFINDSIDNIPRLDLARDLAHHGVVSNKNFCDYILKTI